MFSLNLFSLQVVLALCVAVTASMVFLATQLDREWYRRRLPVVFLITVLFVILGQFAIVRLTNSPGELPPYFMLIEAPFAFGISLALLMAIEKIAVFRRFEEEFLLIRPFHVHKKARLPGHGAVPYLMTAAVIVTSLLFGLVLVNRYYRYYPTLGSVFGTVPASELGNQKRTSHVGKASQAHNPQTTIQGALASLSNPGDGKVFSVSIPGKVSGFHAQDAWVYEPPIALTSAKIKLPVLILLPGEPGVPSAWVTGLNLAQTANAFAKTHDGITPLIVVADDNGSIFNDTECVNSPRGNVETYLTVDVPHYIKQHFTVSDSAAQWAIGGYSMGGTCGIMLTLAHPEVYHYFMDLSGEMGPSIGTKADTIATLFHHDAAAWVAHQPSLLLQKRGAPLLYKHMGGFFADGSNDIAAVTGAQTRLYGLAKTDGLDVVSESLAGKHTFLLWKHVFTIALPWLSNRLGATVCQSACHSVSASTPPGTIPVKQGSQQSVRIGRLQ